MVDKSKGLTKWGLSSRSFHLVALGVLGVVLLVISSLSPGSDSHAPAQPDTADTYVAQADYHQELTDELQEVLSRIAGAGKVRVILKLSSQPLQVLAMNQTSTTRETEERDSQGITRQTVEITEQRHPVLSRNSTGGEMPIVTTVKKPGIEGVLVVCEGGADSRVRSHVVRAVSTLLDIPMYRIQVLPMD